MYIVDISICTYNDIDVNRTATVPSTYYMLITVLSTLYKWSHFYISDYMYQYTYIDIMDMFRYRYEYVSLYLYVKLYAFMYFLFLVLKLVSIFNCPCNWYN